MRIVVTGGSGKAGRWVVARAVGGLAEVVSDGVNGSLARTDDELADALRRIPDYDPFVVAGTAARFSLERHRAGMAAIWATVLEARRGRTDSETAGSDPGAT